MIELCRTDEEKRGTKRVAQRLECEIILNEKHYSGITENISDSGLCFRFLAGPPNDIRDFSLDTDLKIKCKIRPREKVFLNAMVKWVLFHKNPEKGLFDFMGVELQEPPSSYKDFIISLH